jgi:hypothetical protein
MPAAPEPGRVEKRDLLARSQDLQAPEASTTRAIVSEQTRFHVQTRISAQPGEVSQSAATGARRLLPCVRSRRRVADEMSAVDEIRWGDE